jgi:transposase-like protein
VVKVRLDRKATSISLLVVIGVREDGQKILLAVKNMGGETTEAWRTVLDDLIARDLRRPEFLIVDGAPGLEKAIAAVWNGVPVQRCTVHKHRNLLGHAPERLHEEITADYTDMIYAATAEEIEERRKAFVRKWRLRHRAVADSLEEAGDALFAFTRLPPSQWRSARTSNAIERLHEEFKRRIKTQTVLPSADTAAMLFWALLASGPSPLNDDLIRIGSPKGIRVFLGREDLEDDRPAEPRGFHCAKERTKVDVAFAWNDPIREASRFVSGIVGHLNTEDAVTRADNSFGQEWFVPDMPGVERQPEVWVVHSLDEFHCPVQSAYEGVGVHQDWTKGLEHQSNPDRGRVLNQFSVGPKCIRIAIAQVHAGSRPGDRQYWKADPW